MGTVQQIRITLGQAARRLGTSVDAVLELVYAGRLAAEPEPSTGRLLVKLADLEAFAGADEPAGTVG